MIVERFRNMPTRPGAIMQWLIALACLLIAGWLILDQDPEALRKFQFDWWPLTAVPPVLILYFLLFSERSRSLVHLYGAKRSGMLPFLHVLIVSRFMNNLVPQTGNVYRGMRLKHDLGLPWKGYAMISVATVLADISGLIAIGLATLAIRGTSLPGLSLAPLGSGPEVLLVSLGVALAIIPVLLISNKLCNRSAERPETHEHALTFRQSLSVILRPGVALLLFVQTVTMLLSLSTVLWLIFRSMGIDSGFLAAILFVIVTRLVQYVAITPGNIGPRELLYGILGSQMVIGTAAAVAASIVLRIFSWTVLAVLLIMARIGTANPESNEKIDRAG